MLIDCVLKDYVHVVFQTFWWLDILFSRISPVPFSMHMSHELTITSCHFIHVRALSGNPRLGEHVLETIVCSVFHYFLSTLTL